MCAAVLLAVTMAFALEPAASEGVAGPDLGAEPDPTGTPAPEPATETRYVLSLVDDPEDDDEEDDGPSCRPRCA